MDNPIGNPVSRGVSNSERLDLPTSLDWIGRLNQLKKRQHLKRLLGPVSEFFWLENDAIWSLLVVDSHNDIQDSKIEIRLCDADSVSELGDSRFEFSNGDLDYLATLVRRGDWVWMILSDNQIVGQGVTVFGYKKMYSKRFRLKRHECFITRVSVFPQFRGQGIMPRALNQVYGMVKKHSSKTTVFVDIATHNTSSMKAFAKTGMKVTNSGLVRLRFCGKDFVFPYGKFKERFCS